MPSTPVLITEGDLVSVTDKGVKDILCYVETITKTNLGWNTYCVRDFNGRLYPRKSKMDLTPYTAEIIDADEMRGLLEAMDMPLPYPTIMDSSIVNTDEESKSTACTSTDPDVQAQQPDEGKGRFKMVTPAELEALANSSTSKSTNYQTKWAVHTFGGKYYNSCIDKNISHCLG